MKYILTIDDDEALCKLVKKCIETAQVPVYTFLRGEDALSFFYQNQSDCVLVILDIMLPGMDPVSDLGWKQCLLPPSGQIAGRK